MPGATPCSFTISSRSASISGSAFDDSSSGRTGAVAWFTLCQERATMLSQLARMGSELCENSMHIRHNMPSASHLWMYNVVFQQRSKLLCQVMILNLHHRVLVKDIRPA